MLCFLFLNACSIPDASLFQKGSGSLYEGGIDAKELATEDTGDTGEDDIWEDTAVEDTGTRDSATDTATDDSGQENSEN